MIKNPLVWTIVIFICAAVFRLTALDLIEFKLDEARDVYEMELFWQNPHILERGTIQSTGVYNPPLWYFFLAVISAPSRDPEYLSFMIALINCVAVAGFYLVVRRFFGQWVGVSASLLLAFSPWNILFSRKIWAPDMIVPLLVPFLYCLFVILEGVKRPMSEALLRIGSYQDSITSSTTSFQNDKKWAWFGLVLMLGLLAQLHASGIFLVVATAMVVIARSVATRQSISAGNSWLIFDFKYALLGLTFAVIPLLPYINYQIRTGCEDCRNYSAYQEGEVATATPVYDGQAFFRPFQFINGSGWDNTLGDGGFRDFQEKYPIAGIFNFIFLAEFLLLPIGALFIFKVSYLRCLSLLSYLILVPILYFLTKTPSHLYYFLIISPISLLVYAFGIFHLGGILANRSATIRGVLNITIIIVITVINIIFVALFYKYLSETKVIPGDYGVTYGVVKEMAGEKKGLERAEFWVRLFLPTPGESRPTPGVSLPPGL